MPTWPTTTSCRPRRRVGERLPRQSRLSQKPAAGVIAAHADLYRAIDRLSQETGSRELVDLLRGGRQHSTSTSTKAWLTRRTVDQYLVRVEELLDKLRALPA